MSEREQTPTVEPTWEIAQLFPNQGQWSEEEYLSLSTNRLVEFSDGTIEILPMPTFTHQLIVFYLQQALWRYLSRLRLGVVVASPLPVRLRPGKYREPDIVCVLNQNRQRKRGTYSDGADLVMEVVSPDNPPRDYEIKRVEYAEAGIAEYWIVDPQLERILVLKLAGQEYETHGEFHRGDIATSVLLDGFSVEVAAMLAAGEDL